MFSKFYPRKIRQKNVVLNLLTGVWGLAGGQVGAAVQDLQPPDQGRPGGQGPTQHQGFKKILYGFLF